MRLITSRIEWILCTIATKNCKPEIYQRSTPVKKNRKTEKLYSGNFIHRETEAGETFFLLITREVVAEAEAEARNPFKEHF